VLLLMAAAPVWIVIDVLGKGDSFFRAFRRTEQAISTRGIAIALIALVVANWIWNFYKGY
jgi:hypothetical protein